MCGTEIHEPAPVAPTPGTPLIALATQGDTCSCCATTDAVAAPTDGATETGVRYELAGLTCGHCVQTVESAVSGVAGVESANINLVAGGTSTLTISGSVAPAKIRAAVVEAGYTIAAG